MALCGRLSQAREVVARREELQGRPRARVKQVHCTSMMQFCATRKFERNRSSLRYATRISCKRGEKPSNIIRGLVSARGRKSGTLRSRSAAFAKFLASFFLGTLAPFLRASDKPIAIACFLALHRSTFTAFAGFRVPLFSRCTALLTLLPAAFPYFAIEFSFDRRSGGRYLMRGLAVIKAASGAKARCAWLLRCTG